ncbi:MAG: hypothetical protein HFE51_10855 [Clostridia bacterium]|nr:hypothetical protein [Clostridia bacterium]
MKKLLIIALTGIMMLTMVGCGYKKTRSQELIEQSQKRREESEKRMEEYEKNKEERRIETLEKLEELESIKSK